MKDDEIEELEVKIWFDVREGSYKVMDYLSLFFYWIFEWVMIVLEV